MTVAVQIRDVPDQVRDLLAAEAKRQGQSVQAYLLAVIEREASSLANAATFLRTEQLRVPLDDDPVTILREGRDGGFDGDREYLS